ncbi:hypothetical protein ACFY3U_27225 [Micromonospora sp. NPDC000089]|uniref:hypothetical protein n=1 Tax=unclassified Micromonospora TaxID=2617518 RepID=UPI003679C0BB
MQKELVVFVKTGPALVAWVCKQEFVEGNLTKRIYVDATLVNRSSSIPYFVNTITISESETVGEFLDFCVFKAWLKPGQSLVCSGNSKWSAPTPVGRFSFHDQPGGQLRSEELKLPPTF